MKFTIGKKIEMTELFDKDSGNAVPVTLVDVSEVKVAGEKTKEKDGYVAILLGIGKKKKPTKSETRKYEKLGYVPKRVFEFKIEDGLGEIKVGQEWFPSLEEGSLLDVGGLSKGKGFAGVVKRWGFKGGPKTHGQSDRWRHPGSIGAGTTPGRVFKGKKMGGRMGGENVTMKNLKLVKVMKEENILVVKGAVPGAKDGYLLIKAKKFT